MQKKFIIIILLGLLTTVIIGNDFVKWKKQNAKSTNTNIEEPLEPAILEKEELYKAEEELVRDNTDELYDELLKTCYGDYVATLKKGEEQPITTIKTTDCENQAYVSQKIRSYYDDEENIILVIKLAEKREEALYDLENNYLGLEEENKILEYGTEYEYVYKEELDGSENLIKVRRIS